MQWLRKSIEVIKLWVDVWNTDPLDKNEECTHSSGTFRIVHLNDIIVSSHEPERSRDSVWQQDDFREVCILSKLDIMVGEFELKLNLLSNFQCIP